MHKRNVYIYTFTYKYVCTCVRLLCLPTNTLLILPTVPQGFVYWSEEVTQSVCRADKHNGQKLQVVLLDGISPGDVVIVQPALQPEGAAPPPPPSHSLFAHLLKVVLLGRHQRLRQTLPHVTQGSMTQSGTPCIYMLPLSCLFLYFSLALALSSSSFLPPTLLTHPLSFLPLSGF